MSSLKSENSKAIPEPIRLDEKPKALCPFSENMIIDSLAE
jgi:hypothetical protein